MWNPFSRRGRESAGTPDPVEKGLEATLAFGKAGEAAITEALRWTLDSLLPEQRRDFLDRLISELPPGTRLALLAGAVPVNEIVDRLEAEERQPTLIRDIIEHGRASRTLDLTVVPPRCRLVIPFYEGLTVGIPTDKAELQPPTSELREALWAISLGNGNLQLTRRFRTRLLGDLVRAGTVVRLSGRDPVAKEAVGHITFGYPAWLQAEGQDREVRSAQSQELFVGNAQMNEVQVFFED